MIPLIFWKPQCPKILAHVLAELALNYIAAAQGYIGVYNITQYSVCWVMLVYMEVYRG